MMSICKSQKFSISFSMFRQIWWEYKKLLHWSNSLCNVMNKHIYITTDLKNKQINKTKQVFRSGTDTRIYALTRHWPAYDTVGGLSTENGLFREKTCMYFHNSELVRPVCFHNSGLGICVLSKCEYVLGTLFILKITERSVIFKEFCVDRMLGRAIENGYKFSYETFWRL